MNCNTARGLFSLRLDEGLSYEEQHALLHHLDVCPGCALEYRKVEKTVGLVRDLPEVPSPEAFLQNVLRAARQAEQIQHGPPVRSFGERVRDFFAGLEWLSSPRFAPAALALGLVVGVTASVLILRSNHPAEIAQQMATPTPQAAEVAAQPPAAPGTTVGPASNPVASGPFEDLVAQMMRRLDSNSQGVAEDTTASNNLQWGPTRDAAGLARQVEATPVAPSGGRQGGRVYVVF